ncbi:serine hydrolase [Porphyrobacter algicida]|uniref:Serine hydrolase n=1 Tax=Qipengyuania algicida TaxID=1836209 RepID=A0A845AFY3_9SPHN|nr:serine hydrolase [Qipengyuania algicida]
MTDQNIACTTDRRGILGLALAGVAASLVTLPTASDAATLSDGIDALLDTTASAYGTVGYSVAVLRRGALVYSRHAGLADREAGTPITDASVYPMFSISKLFLIVELLKAAERGQLDFAMTVGKIRPDLPDAWRRITFEQALAHVSGLPDYIPDFVAPTEDLAFAEIRNLPLRFPAGTRNDYVQTNMLIAREAAEQATGQKIQALASRQFRAAGMTHSGYHTGYPNGAVTLLNLVTSYRPLPKRDGPPPRYTIPSWPEYTYGSTGVFTTLGDMVRWSQALHRGDLVPLDRLRASWAPFQTSTGAPAWHTHGWEYFEHDGVTVVGHGGDVRLVWRHFFRTENPDDCATVMYFDNGGRSTFDRHRLATLLADRVMSGAARSSEAQEETLFRGLASDHWVEAVREVRAMVPLPAMQAIVNRVGYDALNILDARTALTPFAWNTTEFPHSANAHDSLGDAYRAAGLTAAARKSYAQALSLDPESAGTRAKLNELAASAPAD